jgi:post-segregation antitoxin (ccd killing protein)
MQATANLNIQIPIELALALAERREKTGINVSAFVRLAIRHALERPLSFDADLDADERRSQSAAPVLLKAGQ